MIDIHCSSPNSHEVLSQFPPSLLICRTNTSQQVQSKSVYRKSEIVMHNAQKKVRSNYILIWIKLQLLYKHIYKHWVFLGQPGLDRPAGWQLCGAAWKCQLTFPTIKLMSTTNSSFIIVRKKPDFSWVIKQIILPRDSAGPCRSRFVQLVMVDGVRSGLCGVLFGLWALSRASLAREQRNISSWIMFVLLWVSLQYLSIGLSNGVLLPKIGRHAWLETFS